nr:MAG TPA: hypothetical protein [Caudoviricetes sp.]
MSGNGSGITTPPGRPSGPDTAKKRRHSRPAA